MDNMSQFPTPMKELPKKALTNPTSELHRPRLPTTTPTLRPIPRGPQALSNSLSSCPAPRRLEDLIPPPQDGWDIHTGFPRGAVVFQHPQAYPHLWGKNQTLLKGLNSHFPHLWLRLERTPNKKTIVVWAEVAPYSGREGQVEKEGALNGLRAYHKYDTGKLGELPWIGTFYHENRHLFYPGHRYYRVTDNCSGSSVGIKREVRSIYMSFQFKI
jgi:hypothetical protein